VSTLRFFFAASAPLRENCCREKCFTQSREGAKTRKASLARFSDPNVFETRDRQSRVVGTTDQSSDKSSHSKDSDQTYGDTAVYLCVNRAA